MTLTSILISFRSVFRSGIDAIAGPVMSLFAIVAMIDFMVNLLLHLDELDHIKNLIRACLKYGSWFYILKNYPQLLDTLLDGAFFIGQTASGGGVAMSTLTDPSMIIELGLRATQPAWDYLTSYQNILAINFPLMIVVMFSALLVLVAYFIIAIQVFLTLLEFYIIAAIAPAFLAFGPWQKSAFLAEKAIGALFGFAIKIIVLVLILSAAIPVLSEFTMPSNFSLASFGAAFRMAAAACCVALLCWQAPGVAASMGGSPSLSAGGAVGTAAGAIFGAIGAGRMIMGAKNALSGKSVASVAAAAKIPQQK